MNGETPSPPPARQRRAWRRTAALSACWILLLAALLASLQAWPGPAAWRALTRPAAAGALALFVALFLAVTMLRARRWQLLLGAHRRCTWAQTWPIFFWTFLLKSLTPLRAGEVLRALWLRKRGGGELGYGLATVALERALDLLVLVVGGGALVLAGARWPAADGAAAAAGLLVLAGLAVLVLLLPAWTPPLARHLRRLGERLDEPRPGAQHREARPRSLAVRACATAAASAEALGGLRDTGLALRALGLTLAIWGTLVLAYSLVFALLLPGAAGPTAATAVVLAVNLLGVLAGPPGNLGTFEAGALAALAAVGADVAPALPVVLFLHAAVLASTLLAGAIGRFALRRELDGILDLY